MAKRTPEHLEELKKHNLATIDVVVCNLYPFQEVPLPRSRSLESHATHHRTHHRTHCTRHDTRRRCVRRA